MTDDAVARRILKFLRQMNAEDDDDSLREDAVSRDWLTPAGAPTPSGRALARSFDDMERAAFDQ